MRTGLLLGCLALALGTSAALPNTPPDPALQELIRDLERLHAAYGVPAFALTLVSGEHVLWSGARGIADKESGRPATADTLFRIGSITKTFTAMAVLIAEQEGKLTLDTPIRELAPALRLTNPWADRHPVLLVHLLEHTAGLLDLSREEFDSNDPLPPEQALQLAPEARICQWPPGLHASYSNAGPGIAGYALEQATGEPFASFVRARIFEPMDMQGATLRLDANTRSRLAKGYDADGETVIPYWHMLFPAFGAINASPREMGALPQLFLNRGLYQGRRVLTEAMVERMETPATTLAARSGLTYGYGLGNQSFLHRGFLFHGHMGDGDGYLAQFAYNRDSGLGYFLVINAFRSDALRDMRRRVQDYIVHGIPDNPPPPPAETDLSALTGQYQAVTWRFPWIPREAVEGDRIQIYAERGRLYREAPGSAPRELVAVNGLHFRHADEPVATLAFVEHAGQLYLQGDFGNYVRIPDPAP